MNLTDLRAELAEQARQMDTAHEDLLPGARRYATAVRRRRTAVGMASVATVTAAAVALGSAVLDSADQPSIAGSPGAMPSAPIPADPKDVVVDGIRYRAKMPGEHLKDVRVGARGQSQVDLRAIVNRASTIRPLCVSRRAHSLKITVDGVGVGSSQTKLLCSPVPLAGPPEKDAFSKFESSGGGWPDVSGKRVTVRAVLVDAADRPATDPDARIALGVYERQGLRPVGRTAIPTLREHQGVAYRLADLRTAVARDRAAVRLTVPAGKPFLLAWGTDSGGRLRMTGLGQAREDWSMASSTTVLPHPAGEESTATVTLVDGPGGSKPNETQFFLAIYLPAG